MGNVAGKMSRKKGSNVIALFSFKGEEDRNRLSFEKGDEFTVLERAGEHWYLAKDKYGRTGYIAANFVYLKDVLGTKTWLVADIMRRVDGKMSLKKGTNVVALYSFKGQDSDDLSFEKGDEFTILESKGNDWYIAKDKYGRTGYIPGGYVRKKGDLGTEVVKDESGNFKIPSVMQAKKPKSVLVKTSERECDGAIKQKTVALDERTNDFGGLHQEGGPGLRKSIKHREKIQILEALEEEDLTKVGPPLKNFTTDKRFSLGIGSYGTSVFVGILEDDSEVAVKRMLIQACKDAAENEKNILSLIKAKKSPFIVSYRNFLKDNVFMYLIVDLCEETLDEHVHSQNIQHLRIHGRRMIKEMLTGLKFLHEQGILHRDLKPSNILVDVEGHMRLADFGISRVLNDDETTVHTDAKGTESWMAAEVIETRDQIGKGRFKRRSDIQSAGMIAFFILTKGGSPFGSTTFERMANIVAGNPVNLNNLDDLDGRQFVSWLITRKIEDRPSAHQALLHPFMDNVLFEEASRPASILFLEEYHN